MDKLATAAKTQIDAGIILTEKKRNSVPEKDVNKMDKPTNGASRSPQRRKILKTRIDERGREVTEVIWEGKETEAKKADSSATMKADSSATKKADNTVTSVTNRPAAAQKSVANTGPKNQTAKAGGKKAVNKDPKQGNILSFFKKV
ncbi:putative DNA polymerase subunit Cdc27 [Rosa chinensis]|uniref:Putative DNA polymerase subunit Cdc27 n=1 Tax=Rosa chinensis TaxID=74649 RepID=A0A2P6Q9U9_ROSCH|nr:putative DNA polymerase subunit Cdc27 [Rosa chinensis]